MKQGNQVSRLTQLSTAITLIGLISNPIVAKGQEITPSQEKQIQQQEQRQREQAEELRVRQRQAEQERSSQLEPKQAPKGQEASEKEAQADGATCFEIIDIQWSQSSPLPPNILIKTAKKAILSNSGEKLCMTAQNIDALQKRLQSVLLDEGYLTSKVSIPAQNISTGVIMIDWYPGIIKRIITDEGVEPIGSIRILSPWMVGHLYNQREADQALENLKRLASQSQAKIELRPSQEIGGTDVVYSLPKQPWYKRLHANVGLDNSGSKSTGVYQANASVTVDSLFGIHDQLTINYNQNADGSSDRNSRGNGIYWDVAIGRLAFSLGHNRSQYLTSDAGYNNTVIERKGKSQESNATVSYMLYRTDSTKFQSHLKLAHKITRSFIDQTEIPNQFRDFWYVDLSHQLTHYRRDQQYSANLSIRQSLPNRSKALGEIIGYPNWDGSWRVYTLGGSAQIPFKIKSSTINYSTAVKFQHADKPLPSSEHFTIGSRYSVRGFDETFGLSGEDGLTWRNELNYPIKQSDHKVYGALDLGKVSGPATESGAGTLLMGAALGVKGKWQGLSYDCALGVPLIKPTALSSSTPAVYGSLNYAF